MGGLCNGKLGEKFNEVFSELMEGDLSKACRFPSMMMVVMMKGDLSQSITPNLALCRATHGITVEVPALRTAYALPVPKQRSVFSYQLVSLPPSFFGQPSDVRCFMAVVGDPQQSRVDEMGGHPQHKRLPSQGCLRRQHDHTHPRHSQVKLRV